MLAVFRQNAILVTNMALKMSRIFAFFLTVFSLQPINLTSYFFSFIIFPQGCHSFSGLFRCGIIDKGTGFLKAADVVIPYAGWGKDATDDRFTLFELCKKLGQVSE